MVTCRCGTIQVLLHSDEFHSTVGKALTLIDSAPMFDLFRCEACGQLWRYDRPQNIKEHFAVKLDCELDWKTELTTVRVKERLLKKRGGVSTHFCLWGDCSKFRVKGFEYCIDHLYHG